MDAEADARDAISPTIELVLLAREAEARLAAVLEPQGLTVRSLAALRHVAAVSGITPADLARRARLSAEAAATVIRSLERLGAIRPTTTRSGLPVPVVLTSTGEQLLARVEPRVAALDAELFAGDEGAALERALVARLPRLAAASDGE